MTITSCKDKANTNSVEITKDLILDKEIEMANAQYPIKLDNFTTLMSISRDGNVVTYEYEIDENVVVFEKVIPSKDTSKHQLENQLVAMITQNSEFYAFVSLLRDTDKALHYLYKGNHSGKTIRIEFSNDELKKLIKDH
jgi:hypothetical protein